MQREKQVKEVLTNFEGKKEVLECDINEKRKSDSGIDGLDAFRGVFQMYDDLDLLTEKIHLLKWVLEEEF
jgi:hypothetical protein